MTLMAEHRSVRFAGRGSTALRYLPEQVVVAGDVRSGIDRATIGSAQYEELCRRLVFVSVPERYV